MSAQDTAALIIEHGNVFVGDDAGSSVNLGAVRNVKFTGNQVRNKVESDNLGTIINKVRIQGKVELDWLEPGNMAAIENIFKGVVARSTVAGSPVTGATVVKTSGNWAYNQPILLTGQNADGTAPTIASVVGSVNSGPLVADTDYVKVKINGVFAMSAASCAGGGAPAPHGAAGGGPGPENRGAQDHVN